jgi:hypothetical protein
VVFDRKLVVHLKELVNGLTYVWCVDKRMVEIWLSNAELGESERI